MGCREIVKVKESTTQYSFVEFGASDIHKETVAGKK